MNMVEYIKDIYKVLINDEILLRLLYYYPQNQLDDPLSPDKENILDKPDEEKWQIINDVIKTTSNVNNLDTTPKCRILFYPGKRNSTSNNYFFSEQRVIFDILVHFDFEEVDFRLERICDRLNELLFDKRITGIGKVIFENGDKLSAPENYVAYRLIYRFCSENY